MERLAFILLFFSLSSLMTTIHAQAPANASWKLEKQANGIQVYSANVSHSNRKYIKVTAALEGSLEKVQAVFRNIPQQKAWVYATKQAYLIQQVDAQTLLYYNETALPWPASNRDIAISMKLTEDKPHNKLTITQEGKPNATPSKKGLVRIPHMVASWQFRSETTNQLAVDYYMDIDPGGSLPQWVINLFIAKGPYETFANLRQQLKQ